MKWLRVIAFSSFALMYVTALSQGSTQAQKQEFAKRQAEEFQRKKAEAVRLAQEKGWVIRKEFPDGRIIEIMEIGSDGIPEYNTTFNLDAAATTNTSNLWPGGSSGLNLTGSGFTIAEWDGGGVRTTHQEFRPVIGASRVTQKDSPAELSSHSTHVAGTLIAEGQDADAKGMAYSASLHAYDWDDDESEMLNANSVDNIILSNHSYGSIRGWDYQDPYWLWYGDTTISVVEDYKFGFYNEYAKTWDSMAYMMPEYLIVVAAGNDRGDDHHGGHYVYDKTEDEWVYSTTHRDPDGGSDGHDCVGNSSVGKNLLIVGACKDITAGYTQPSDVIIESYSSWGPTDDGRIKPDIVANGQSLYSCNSGADNSYTFKSGTSMASPNITGSLALLQRYYFSLNGSYMMADELKALAINTANEAGAFDGPDYKFGWGLFDATAAATLIQQHDLFGGLIFRSALTNGDVDDYTYYSDGNTPIEVTLCWIDPPHAALTPALNPNTLTLIHDLDLRIITPSGGTGYPWILSPGSPGNAPIRADNDRDNVETYYVASPPAGQYTVRVQHEGTITGTQNYALVISGLRAQMFTNTWTGGSASDLWYADDNWSLDHDPLLVEQVIIPNGSSFHPIIDVIGGKANSLTVGSDVILEIRDDTLTISTDFNMNGQLMMTYSNSHLKVMDDIYWGAGSSANISAPCQIHIYGDWDFNSGSNVIITQGIVNFMGSGNSYIRSKDSDCHFNSLGVYKSSPGKVIHSSLSTTPLKCNGYFYIHFDGTFESNTPQSLVVKGDFFSNQNICNLINGTVVMDGVGQAITFGSPGYFNNLTISPSNYVIINNDIDINGNLLIESGVLNSQNHTINIDGNWTNQVGPSGFTEGTSRVIFDGTTHQYIYGDETFNVLESNMDVAIRINNAADEVTCNSYDWTKGAIDVLAGIFTANDLADNGLYGGFWVNTGATINLYQDASHFTDLNGELHFNGGGTINIYGGDGPSYWAFGAPALIEMNGGILDFKSEGIFLSNANTLTDNLTGGTIRMVGGFNTGTRADFNPTGGIFEFYGTSDAYVTVKPPNTLYNFKVNKNESSDKLSAPGSVNESSIAPSPAIPSRKSPPAPGTRSSTVILDTNLVVNADLIIASGVLDVDTNDYPVYVGRHWYNYVGDAGFLERNGTVTFFGSGESDIRHDETFYNLIEDKTGIQLAALENGTGDYSGTDVTVLNLFQVHDGILELNYPGSLTTKTLLISAGAQLNANDYPGVSIYVKGSWQDENLSSAFSSLNSTVIFCTESAGIVQSVKENDLFDKIIINTAVGAWVRPDNTLGYRLIHASDLDIIDGRLRIGGYKVIIDDLLQVFDILDVSVAADSLIVGSIAWKPGSSDVVNNGKIIVNNSWTWEDGTNADITSGNIVYFKGTGAGNIYSYDASASFYKMEIDKGASSVSINTASTQRVHVMNTLNVIPNSWFYVQSEDLDVDGILDIQNGSSMRLTSGGEVDVATDFTLNGFLDLDGGGDFLVHGTFTEATTGSIEISGSGLFRADKAYPEPRATFALNGSLTMTGGTFEITNNHMNLSATFIDAISGGNIRVGGSFIAGTEVFQPSGGTFTFITTPLTGTYIQSHLNNWFYNLIIDAGVSKAIYGSGGILKVKNDLTINSGSLDGSDDDIFLGDDWINNVGAGGFVSGTSHVYLNGTVPTPESQEISGGTFYNMSNQNVSSVVRFNGATTITNNYYAGAGGADCQSMIIGSPFQVQNQLVLNQGWFGLSGSAPAVTASSLDQGGMIQVTNGSFTANDLADAGLEGDYLLYDGAINLTQDATWIDNNADITITNGTFTVFGGNSMSYWPYTGSHTFTMSGGIMEFKNQGIKLYTNDMTYNITGGTIICPHYFNNGPTMDTFHPSGGTFEMAGTLTSQISLTNGNYLHNLRINKSGASVITMSNLTINGTLDVKSGTFNTNNWLINVGP